MIACTILTAACSGNQDDVLPIRSDKVKFDVPDPDKEGKCKTVTLGEIAGIAGANRLNFTEIIGFHKSYDGKTCCEAFHFINVVVSDPAPPSWKDGAGAHKINPGDIYIDPLSGGNIPPGDSDPKPPTDREPWYDNEKPGRKASESGKFESEDRPEYDLSKAQGWNKDTKLDLLFGDRPSLVPGLEFATILVCSHGKKFCPIAGIAWGRTTEGRLHMEDPFTGTSYPAGLTTAKLQDALKRSGFGEYTVEEKCCPCDETKGSEEKQPEKKER